MPKANSQGAIRKDGSQIKSAWIDERQRIIYFLPMPGAEEYRAAEGPFWEYVLLLMRQGYRVG